MIYPLQYLRALAAVSVVLCHASYYVMQSRGDSRMWDVFGRAGGFGVALFFSISGYLMAHLASITGGMRFLTHRLIRIYPIYWITVLGVTLIGLLFGRVIVPDMFGILLVPGVTKSYVLGVEWTLPFELTFYLIVYAIIVTGLKKYLPLIAIAWVAVIELAFALHPELQKGQFPLLLHLPFSLFSLAFASGLLVPYALSRGMIGPATLVVGLGILIASEAMVPISAGLSSGLMAIACTCFVAAAIRAGVNGHQKPSLPLVALGDWSYALYLCHVPVIMTLCHLMPNSVATMQLWFAAVGLPLVVCVGLGKLDLALYRSLKSWIERYNFAQKSICATFLVTMGGVTLFAYVQLIKEHVISNELAPFAQKLVSSMKGDESTLALASVRAGLKADDTLKGHFDTVYIASGDVRLIGWALQARDGGEPVQVLIFSCGQYLGALSPTVHRADVSAALHLRYKYSGFDATLPARDSCNSNAIDGLIFSTEGRFSIISSQMQFQ